MKRFYGLVFKCKNITQTVSWIIQLKEIVDNMEVSVERSENLSEKLFIAWNEFICGRSFLESLYYQSQTLILDDFRTFNDDYVIDF